MKSIQCIYSPKSKIHLDLGWQSLFLQELRCADKFNVLIRIIHSTYNINSIYADASGAEHPGMLINYSYLSDALCLSRSTLQRILNQLEADGYISRIKLGRGKVLAQATQKSFDLRDEIHASSLAAKTNANDLHKLSNNFEVVYTQQKEIPGQFNSTGSKNNLGQFDRVGSQELSRVGQIDRALLNEFKVKQKNNNLKNQYQVLEAVTEFENSDCLTVVFYFDEFGLGEIHAEEDLFDYFTVAQSKILNTIVYCYAESLDINVFNETLTRQDLRKEAQNFRQLVDWAYATAMGNQEKNIVSKQGLQSILNEAIITSNDQNSAEKSIADFNVCDTNHQGVSDRESITQRENNGVMENNNTADLYHGKIIYGNQAFRITANSTATSALNEVTRTKQLRSAINSNTINLMEAFKVRGTDNQNVKKEISTTQADGGSVMAYNNTSNFNNDKSTFSNQAYHKNSAANLTAEDIKMPVVEKEVLRKDWASLADQSFYEGVLPDSQKIALVAIIDYVKRKGVVIGSDAEIYRWLYHTASNHQHYYSRANNFKHLANILIKQLMNKKFEKPSGFNAWEQRIQQQIGCSSMLQKE